jgi:DNA topoisomerase-2
MSAVDETLSILQLAEWVRLRPDTFVGSVATNAELRWIVGKRDEITALGMQQPVSLLSERDAKRLRGQQLVVGNTRPVSSASSVASGEGSITLDAEVEVETSTPDSELIVAAASSRASALKLADATAALLLLESCPAAEKIVDEILQNALDRQGKDSLMKKITVTVDAERGRVTVRNDGHGMKVTKPERTRSDIPDEYWPAICCSREFAGGSFAIKKEHYQGGRNGIGMKATNILSVEFTIEVGDIETKQFFKQTWRNGMSETTVPVVKPYRAKTGYVEISFVPDMAYFKQPRGSFTPAFAALLRSRVWELTAVAESRISIWLDGEKLPARNIVHFASLFAPGTKPVRSTVVLPSGKVAWDITLLPTSAELQPGVVAFVNGIRCAKGAHVNHAMNVIRDVVQDSVRRKCKLPSLELTPTQVKQSMFILMSVWIDGPRFDRQSKDKLDSPVSEWGFVWRPDDAATKRIVGMVADDISSKLTDKADADAVKTATKATGGRRSINIPKYEPAGDAGKPNTSAFLILTEGDSAKGLAMAGRAVTGSKLVGVFCLKGKPPNTRGEMVRSFASNEVLNNVARILGLEYKKVFTTEADLRCLNYKLLVLLADQDYDGYHIVGLVCNWIESCWPSLLKLRPDFIRRFATPIIIANAIPSQRSKLALPVESHLKFLSMPEFKRWLSADLARKTAFDFQYIKGLGGHSSKHGREYFAAYEHYSMTIDYLHERDHITLDKFFGKTHADTRKHLIGNVYSENDTLDYTLASVTMSEFLMVDTLAFFHDDVMRSIPGPDGLKRTQRKLLWATRQILAPGKVCKLTDLAMDCGKRSHYHHGEQSLFVTMVGMAQAHPGTNNINLFVCEAQMGDRHNPCSQFTAPRYLSTGPVPVLQYLLRPEDDAILTYRVEDGKHLVEPVCFYPVVPIDVINGSVGIGTGWNTMIVPHHPHDVVSAIRAYLEGVDGWEAAADALLPWFDGLTGPILDEPTQWRLLALYTVHRVNADVVNIVLHDLPYACWTHNYQEKVLQPRLVGKPGGFIIRIDSDTTDTRISYTLACDSALLATELGSHLWETAPEGYLAEDARPHSNTADPGTLRQAAAAYGSKPPRYPGLEKVLKLSSVLYKSWMYRLDADGHIVHYPGLSDLLKTYGGVRLEAYAHRLEYQVHELQREMTETAEKLRFVGEITARTMSGMDYENVEEWWSELSLRGYVAEGDVRIAKRPLKVLADLPVDLTGSDILAKEKTYHYLTDMRMSSCTAGSCKRLSAALQRAAEKLKVVQESTPKGVWLCELDEFLQAYAQFAANRARENLVEIPSAAAKPKKTAVVRKRKAMA